MNNIKKQNKKWIGEVLYIYFMPGNFAPNGKRADRMQIIQLKQMQVQMYWWKNKIVYYIDTCNKEAVEITIDKIPNLPE